MPTVTVDIDELSLAMEAGDEGRPVVIIVPITPKRGQHADVTITFNPDTSKFYIKDEIGRIVSVIPYIWFTDAVEKGMQSVHAWWSTL